jgi:cation diffusion facilitator CzcD-associated flavoprotein CzcO
MSMEKEHALSPRIVVIGAGMAGILTAIQLRRHGYDDFVVYEKAERLGGTWRENTYPGLSCDVPAHLYTYSFEPNPHWSRTFAPGPEIQAYFERVADKYDVVRSIRFGDGIPHCEFRNGHWRIRTSTGKEDVADVIIAATGVLHHPNLPALPGLDTFGGSWFHSARWKHGVELDGKRIGVVGTGSTAIQITSAMAKRVAKFALFQRTAQWVMPIENLVYSEEQRATLRTDPAALDVLRDKLNEGFQFFANAVIDADSDGMKEIEKACRENLENNVKDPVLREKLRPNYRAACKRLIFSPDFYEAIQHPSADVVTSGIERIEPRGVRTEDGELHELDVLVLATGFHADSFIRPTVVLGRNGVDLDDVWEQHPVAYLSISIPEFPNFFMINGPNGPVGNFSLIQIAEAQVAYILQLLEQIRIGNCREISASAAATVAFEKKRSEAAKKSIWATGCKSWYLDKHGIPASWPWTPSRFFEEMNRPKLEFYDQVV